MIRKLQPCAVPFRGGQAAGFHQHCGRLVVKITTQLGREMGTGQVKRPQNLQFIRRFTHFSWINACQIVESLLLISRVLKKFILTIFASVAIALMEEWIFRGPYHAFPVVHSNSSHPLMAVLIYVSLMSNDVQDIFLCLLVICISFVMCLLKYFAYLKKQILPFYR